MNETSQAKSAAASPGTTAGALPSAAARLWRLAQAPFRRYIGATARSLALRRGLRALRRGAGASDALLERLSWAWDNEGFSGDCSYLRRVVEAARAVRGPVLECGSGLTSLLVAACASTGLRAYSLEHVGEWRRRVRDRAERCGLTAEVLDAELASYGEYDWYRVPETVPAGIQLVICDGPPASTRGGRYGLLPVCASLLAPGCVILLDDAERADERRIAERWQREFGLSCEWRNSGAGVYAELTVTAAGVQLPAASEQNA